MIQYILNILTTYQAGKLQIHCSVYSERTQHVLIQESVGILDMEPSCTKHVLAQYRGVCPQCHDIVIGGLFGISGHLNPTLQETPKAPLDIVVRQQSMVTNPLEGFNPTVEMLLVAEIHSNDTTHKSFR
jgi:hypothetical protein